MGKHGSNQGQQPQPPPEGPLLPHPPVEQPESHQGEQGLQGIGPAPPTPQHRSRRQSQEGGRQQSGMYRKEGTPYPVGKGNRPQGDKQAQEPDSHQIIGPQNGSACGHVRVQGIVAVEKTGGQEGGATTQDTLNGQQCAIFIHKGTGA